jgi:hypothetical protein
LHLDFRESYIIDDIRDSVESRPSHGMLETIRQLSASQLVSPGGTKKFLLGPHAETIPEDNSQNSSSSFGSSSNSSGSSGSSGSSESSGSSGSSDSSLNSEDVTDFLGLDEEAKMSNIKISDTNKAKGQNYTGKTSPKKQS